MELKPRTGSFAIHARCHSWVCVIKIFTAYIHSHAQAERFKENMKTPKPDALCEELIQWKHVMNASLDAAVAEWKGS